jgi:hypothetical protein
MDKLNIDAILAITRLSFCIDKMLERASLIQPRADEKIYAISTLLTAQTNPRHRVNITTNTKSVI